MTTTTGEPGTATRASRALGFGLCTAVVAVAFEAMSVATAMPAAARDLDGLSLYAWAFSLFLIGQLFATIAGGRWCDRAGAARPMAGGVSLFAVGIVVAATAPVMVQLVVGRLLQGLGAGLVSIAMYVVIAQAFDEARRAVMFSYISTAWVAPSIVGPGVAAWLTHQIDWRAVFWAVLPLLALGSAVMLPQVFRVANRPVPADDNPAPPTALWAAGLAAVGAAVLQAAGQRLNLLGAVLAVLGLGLVAVSLPRLMPVGFFAFRPGLTPVILTRTLIAGAFFGAESFMPLMLVEQRGVSLLVAGSILTVGALGWSAGSWMQASRRLRIRRNHSITAGAASILLGILTVCLVTWLHLWIGLVAIGWLVAALGMGLAMSSTSLATMTLSPPAEQGRNASSLQFGEAFGGGLFIGVSGTVFAALHPSGHLTTTFGGVLTAMSVVALLAVLVSLRTGAIRTVVVDS
jgi:MFS family permease